MKKMYVAGYTNIETRELVAADYGAPTTRKRWYAVFRRDGKEIRWPEQTHSADGIGFEKWKPCGDYIDWSDLGSSIFERRNHLQKLHRRESQTVLRNILSMQNLLGAFVCLIVSIVLCTGVKMGGYR